MRTLGGVVCAVSLSRLGPHTHSWCSRATSLCARGAPSSTRAPGLVWYENTGCRTLTQAWDETPETPCLASQGKDHTLFALIQGTLRFKRSAQLGRTFVVLDSPAAAAAASAVA